MTTLELVIPTIGATSAVVLAAALVRADGAALISRIFGALLCVGVAIYLPCSMHSSACVVAPIWPLTLLASGVPFFFWSWTRSVMDDEFRMTPLALIAGSVLIVSPFVGDALTYERVAEWGIVAHSVMGIAFVVAALIEVLRGWRQDLIEARRRLRLVLLVVCGVYSVSVLSVELFLQIDPVSQRLKILNASALTALLLGLSIGVLSVSQTLRRAFGWMPPQGLAGVQPAEVQARNQEQEVIAKLQACMTDSAAYRNPALSIAQLAAVVGVHEKRLRDIINRQLGHKNFSSYVNAFRLEEVRRRLVDARHDHLPILTLALDAGFGSVVAFNRAFKDTFEVTPSEYRAKHKRQE